MVKNGARNRRILEAARIYRAGATLTEVGQQLSPPVSQQAVSRMFADGVRSGLLAELPQMRRRRGDDLTVDQVREAATTIRKVDRLASALDIDVTVLKQRFGQVLEEVTAARVAESLALRKAAVIEVYVTISKDLGRPPTSSELTPSLSRRIRRTFGSFEAFWLAVGQQPPPRRTQSTATAKPTRSIVKYEPRVQNLIVRWARYIPFNSILQLHHDHVVFEGNHEPVGGGLVRLKYLPLRGMIVVIPIALVRATQEFYKESERSRAGLVFPALNSRAILTLLLETQERS